MTWCAKLQLPLHSKSNTTGMGHCSDNPCPSQWWQTREKPPPPTIHTHIVGQKTMSVLSQLIPEVCFHWSLQQFKDDCSQHQVASHRHCEHYYLTVQQLLSNKLCCRFFLPLPPASPLLLLLLLLPCFLIHIKILGSIHRCFHIPGSARLNFHDTVGKEAPGAQCNVVQWIRSDSWPCVLQLTPPSKIQAGHRCIYSCHSPVLKLVVADMTVIILCVYMPQYWRTIVSIKISVSPI